jgi:XTP/dITP diphosphohydrolase
VDVEILIGTNNLGKQQEFRQLLTGLPVRVYVPADLELSVMPAETGRTFAENAMIKARDFMAAAGMMAMADDSGLCVDALDGRPGIYSARYGGPHLRDEQRVQLLLQELSNVPDERRTAKFVCVIALASDASEWTVEGQAAGVITREPRGLGGFGYDPIFQIPGMGVTFAELDADAKHRLSHRGQAFQRARERLVSPP